MAFTLLPAAFHDLTPVHVLTFPLASGVGVCTDKAYSSRADEVSILAKTGLRLVPIRRANMRPNLWVDKLALSEYRPWAETTNSQLEAMGLQRLQARTNADFELKVHASLLALLNAR